MPRHQWGGFMRRVLPFVLFIISQVAAPIQSQEQRRSAPVTYAVSFPEPEHHWMQVEATFTNLGAQPLDVRMSRSSPGRYAIAEFAKNVFFVEAYNGKGTSLRPVRPEVDVWRVTGHDGTVRVTYRIFGDYPNGTFFGVDTTHAHVQMPAAFMWAVGHENRPIRISFTTPRSLNWK